MSEIQSLIARFKDKWLKLKSYEIDKLFYTIFKNHPRIVSLEFDVNSATLGSGLQLSKVNGIALETIDYLFAFNGFKEDEEFRSLVVEMNVSEEDLMSVISVTSNLTNCRLKVLSYSAGDYLCILSKLKELMNTLEEYNCSEDEHFRLNGAQCFNPWFEKIRISSHAVLGEVFLIMPNLNSLMVGVINGYIRTLRVNDLTVFHTIREHIHNNTPLDDYSKAWLIDIGLKLSDIKILLKVALLLPHSTYRRTDYL